MTKEDAVRRAKLIEVMNDAQANYFAEPSNRNIRRQYNEDFGGLIGIGAGSDMIDPIILDEIDRNFTADEYADLANKRLEDIIKKRQK